MAGKRKNSGRRASAEQLAPPRHSRVDIGVLRSFSAAIRRRVSLLTRIFISVLLIAHLTIVVCAPLVMVTPRSPLALRVVEWARWYLEAGNVSHGYAFFAPEPGPSHVIEYDLLYADGRKEHGKFPDLEKHQPRQRYHRHFMLTEQLSSLAPVGRPSQSCEK